MCHACFTYDPGVLSQLYQTVLCSMLMRPRCGFTNSLTSLFLALSHNTVDLEATAESPKLKNTNESHTNVRRAGLRGGNLDTLYATRASYHQTVRSIMTSSRIPDVQYRSILQKFLRRSLFKISSEPELVKQRDFSLSFFSFFGRNT